MACEDRGPKKVSQEANTNTMDLSALRGPLRSHHRLHSPLVQLLEAQAHSGAVLEELFGTLDNALRVQK